MHLLDMMEEIDIFSCIKDATTGKQLRIHVFFHFIGCIYCYQAKCLNVSWFDRLSIRPSSGVCEWVRLATCWVAALSVDLHGAPVISLHHQPAVVGLLAPQVRPGGGGQPQQVVVFPQVPGQEQVRTKDGHVVGQVPHRQVVVSEVGWTRGNSKRQ